MDDFRRSANEATRYAPYLSGPASAVDKAEIAAARPKVQADIVTESTGLVLAKTHTALISDRGHPTINRSVSAGAIYVVRNPLDVAVSFAAFVDKPLDRIIEEMATPGWGYDNDGRDVYYITGSWSENVASWSGNPNSAILVVRYEDLLENPDQHFGGISAHIRSGATQEQIRRAIELASFQRLQQAEQTHGFHDTPETAPKFFREGRAGQWRDALTGDQVRRITVAHRLQMQRFGYA
jgi:hypothetical protein